MIRYLKRLKASTFVRAKAFPMYGGMGVSAPSLHRESTDSLIRYNLLLYTSLLHIYYIPRLHANEQYISVEGQDCKAIHILGDTPWYIVHHHYFYAANQAAIFPMLLLLSTSHHGYVAIHHTSPSPGQGEEKTWVHGEERSTQHRSNLQSPSPEQGEASEKDQCPEAI